ncbi:MAG: ABC transporter substrate-binding protein [Atribacterota bacterium]|nr:ABC transporter substrate-binding protein [Atribacterota bacterium]
MKKNYLKKIIATLVVIGFMLSIGINISANETVIFGDAGWESIRFHSHIAGIIMENGFGYSYEMIAGSSPVILTGMRRGDIDVQMEMWTSNIAEIYQEALDSGDIVELGVNFDGNTQGLYVPTFLIEGDSARDIEPMAPELKTVKDLANYWQVFEDEEDRSKGRIYGSPPGWAVDEIMRTKVETYGLDEYYNYFSPGSDTALAAAIVSAYERGEPIVAYYWEPTWIMGMMDMTLLEDEPYSEELWNNGYACEFESMEIAIAANADFADGFPELAEFLSKYRTSEQLTNEALAYMMENETDEKDAAIWFLKNREDVWGKWVSEDIAQKVRASL